MLLHSRRVDGERPHPPRSSSLSQPGERPHNPRSRSKRVDGERPHPPRSSNPPAGEHPRSSNPSQAGERPHSPRSRSREVGLASRALRHRGAIRPPFHLQGRMPGGRLRRRELLRAGARRPTSSRRLPHSVATRGLKHGDNRLRRQTRGDNPPSRHRGRRHSPPGVILLSHHLPLPVPTSLFPRGSSSRPSRKPRDGERPPHRALAPVLLRTPTRIAPSCAPPAPVRPGRVTCASRRERSLAASMKYAKRL